MKEMVYGPDMGKREILYSGEYNGHQFYIVSYQSHPCCYVRTDLPDRESQNIECHGGITFSSYAFEEFDVKGHYIGWDYAHCGDLTGWIGRGVAHTTEKMYSDVKKVIDQIIKLEGGEKNG